MHDPGSSPSPAVVHVWQHRARYLILWSAPDHATYSAIRASFHASFPRHGDAYYDRVRCAWSIPVRHRRRLDEWIERTFPRAGRLIDDLL